MTPTRWALAEKTGCGFSCSPNSYSLHPREELPQLKTRMFRIAVLRFHLHASREEHHPSSLPLDASVRKNHRQEEPSSEVPILAASCLLLKPRLHQRSGRPQKRQKALKGGASRPSSLRREEWAERTGGALFGSISSLTVPHKDLVKIR